MIKYLEDLGYYNLPSSVRTQGGYGTVLRQIECSSSSFKWQCSQRTLPIEPKVEYISTENLGWSPHADEVKKYYLSIAKNTTKIINGPTMDWASILDNYALTGVSIVPTWDVENHSYAVDPYVERFIDTYTTAVEDRYQRFGTVVVASFDNDKAYFRLMIACKNAIIVAGDVNNVMFRPEAVAYFQKYHGFTRTRPDLWVKGVYWSSYACAIVTACAALLMVAGLPKGQKRNGKKVREALLATRDPDTYQVRLDLAYNYLISNQ